MSRARVALVVNAATLQLRHALADRFLLFAAVAQPAFLVATVLVAAQHRAVSPLYIAIGSGLAGMWSAMLFGGSTIVRTDRWLGTLEYEVASPAPLLLLFAGRMLGIAVLSVAGMVTTVATVALTQGGLRTESIGLALLAGLVSLGAMWAAALMIAPLAVLSPAAQQMLNGLEYPIYIIGGFLFPISLLPDALAVLARALPPYWIARTTYGAAHGDLAELGVGWLIEVVYAVASLMLALVLFRVAVVRARRDGSLALS